ncbi:hypothetical protein, partial [Actinobacillus pleuropneumoniae]
KKAGALRINEAHKEMLFHKWDAQIRKAVLAAKEAAIVANNIFDYVNENLHRENLISKTALGFLPKAQQLQTSWRQKVEERA